MLTKKIEDLPLPTEFSGSAHDFELIAEKNLSLWFASRYGSFQPAQLQRLSKIKKTIKGNLTLPKFTGEAYFFKFSEKKCILNGISPFKMQKSIYLFYYFFFKKKNSYPKFSDLLPETRLFFLFSPTWNIELLHIVTCS